MNTKSRFYTSTLEEEKLTFVSLDDDTLTVQNDLGGQELYVRNNHFAGWTLTYEGDQYEFCRSV